MILMEGLILVVVILVLFGVIYLINDRYHTWQLSQQVSKNILNKGKQQCQVCDNVYYTCTICGCQFDNELDARRCWEWDLILRRKHSHQYLHHHDEEKKQ